MGDSSSDKTGKNEEPIEQEHAGLAIVSTGLGGYQSKLDVSQMTMFGFPTSQQDLDAIQKPKNVDAKDAKQRKGNVKNRNQTVVYGADDDDDADVDNDDYDNPDYDYDNDDLDGESEDDQEEEGENEEARYGYDPNDGYFASDEFEGDDMWVDEGELLDDGEGAEDAALLAEQMERERQRQERLAEIQEKKESLIERYLKIARIMINHRKKNIYLQDYLFHLALRKGILRGDPVTNAEEESSNAVSKAQKKRHRRKNAIMANRFARFLRKTGHLFDNDENTLAETSHHHHYHKRRSRHPTHPDMSNDRLRSNLKSISPQGPGGRNPNHHHKHVHTTVTVVTKNHNHNLCVGKECESKSKLKAKQSTKSVLIKTQPRIMASRNKGMRPLTLQERLEKKAAATLQFAMQNANMALNEFERHRCRMVKKKQLIKISKLLERQYNGVTLVDPERAHLVSFVEKSVTSQNLAKRKALRRQKKPERAGVATLNHQWIKSLERIRELRIRRAKLEQEHRLQLLRKVKHWHIWEKRDLFAIDAVYEYIEKMSSHVIMSKKETETFSAGLGQFDKQLHYLHDAMLTQIIKMFKTKSSLCMAQRKVKDSASVLSTKAFTIADYERMIIENSETHDKLVDKQNQLLKEHEKLLKYMKEVAKRHSYKQNSWGALRAGRHDMKALWELCLVERDNLLKKFRELKRVKQFQKRMFLQSAILENKRCYMDYQRVNHRVDELSDKKRTLKTKHHSVQSALRVLNVKVDDTLARINMDDKEQLESSRRDKVAQCNATVGYRINPHAPNTIHNVNMSNEKSKNILQPTDKNNNSPRQNKKLPQATKNETKNKGKTRLPPV